MTLDEAVEAVENSEAQRICAPSQWVVWRDGDKIKVEIKS